MSIFKEREARNIILTVISRKEGKTMKKKIQDNKTFA